MTANSAARREKLLTAIRSSNRAAWSTSHAEDLYRIMEWGYRATVRRDLRRLVADGLLILHDYCGRRFHALPGADHAELCTGERPVVPSAGRAAARALQAAGIAPMVYGVQPGWVIGRYTPDSPLMANWAHTGPVGPGFFTARPGHLARMAEVLREAGLAVAYLPEQVGALYLGEYPQGPDVGLRYGVVPLGGRYAVLDTYTSAHVHLADTAEGAENRAADFEASGDSQPRSPDRTAGADA